MLKDVWDAASDLGLRVSKYTAMSKLYFTSIKQDWLKDIAKKFIKYMAATRSYGTLRIYLGSVK